MVIYIYCVGWGLRFDVCVDVTGYLCCLCDLLCFRVCVCNVLVGYVDVGDFTV